jgi:arylesterase/paraoxonase
MRRSVGWIRIAVCAVLVVLLVVAGFLLQLVHAAGQFKTLDPHFAGACAPVAGLMGPEDVTIHPRTGVAYVSAYDRRAAFAGGDARGALYAYDLTVAAPRLKNLTPSADPSFAPHGISLLPGDGGGGALYAINHAGGRHTIEVYDLAGAGLVHRETLSDPLLVTPNDLVALGRARLYVTNDHANPRGLGRTLEDYLRRQISTVVHYDGERWEVAASGIRYPNGVNASPDGGTLYVASSSGREVLRFQIDPVSGHLVERSAIAAGSGVDNIELDAAGDLWIGAHPKLLTFVQHAGDASVLSPSQVLRVRAPGSDAPAVEEVFLSLGADLSGSSVGAVWRDRLLIGAVFDAHLLDCRMSR